MRKTTFFIHESASHTQHQQKKALPGTNFRPTDSPPPIHAETETATFPVGRILDNLQLQQQIPCIYHRSLIAEYVR